MKKYTFLRFPGFKDKAVTLSYDDGSVYDRKLIEIMMKNGLKGTFNLNSGMFPENEGGRRLTKEQAISLYLESGNEVAIHGTKHLSLTEVDEAIATNDVLNDRLNLEKLFGTIIKGMAYANGSCDARTANIVAKCGIEFARTTITTETFNIPEDWLMMPTTCHHKNPRLMELAKKFLDRKESAYFWANTPQLFYLWGHSYEFNDDNNWEIIEEFANFIGNKNDVWYATNGEIYRYVKAYEMLKYSADGKTVYNPGCISVYINYYGKEVEIGAGEFCNL